MLCTVNQVKALLEIGAADTGQDAVLAQICAEVSEQFSRVCGRVVNGLPCLERWAGAEFFSPGPEYYSRAVRLRNSLWLTARPVIAITEVKEALAGAFDDADELLEHTNYEIQLDTGELMRWAGFWLPGARTIRVRYSGGYSIAEAWVAAADYAGGDRCGVDGLVYVARQDIAGDAGNAAPVGDENDADWLLCAGEVPLPLDLRQAAIQQSAYWLRRRRELGVSAAGNQGGNWNAAQGQDDLLPGVRATLARYRRAM